MVNHELYNEWWANENLLTCLRSHYANAKRAGLTPAALAEVKKELDDFEAKYNARYMPAPREKGLLKRILNKIGVEF